MKTVRIIALHLAYGGIEKAIISMANLFAERYQVEIISVYDMPNAPAFSLDALNTKDTERNNRLRELQTDILDEHRCKDPQ